MHTRDNFGNDMAKTCEWWKKKRWESLIKSVQYWLKYNLKCPPREMDPLSLDCLLWLCILTRAFTPFGFILACFCALFHLLLDFRLLERRAMPYVSAHTIRMLNLFITQFLLRGSGKTLCGRVTCRNGCVRPSVCTWERVHGCVHWAACVGESL